MTAGCSTPSFTVTHKILDYPKSFVRDAINLVEAPAHWDDTDFMKLAWGIGVTGAVMQTDRPVHQMVLENRSDKMDKLCSFVAPFGKGGRVRTAEIGVFALSYPLGDYNIADTAFLAFESTIFSTTIERWLKGITHRERPRRTNDPYDFHFQDSYSKKMPSSAFPSGDVTAAFSWASVVAARSDSLTIGVISYGLAGLVGVERVYVNAHWASDVCVAAAIGTIIGITVVKFNSGNQSSDHSNVSLVPIMNENSFGAEMIIQF
jgi:hypothetical protein